MTKPPTRSITQKDLDRAALQRDHALAAYQQALADFERKNPPPPCTWSTWPEANERARRQKTALAPQIKRLDHARSRYRDLLCLHIHQPQDLQP